MVKTFTQQFAKISNRIFDIMVISVLHVLLCVPLITIGGAETALARVSMQWTQGEDASFVDYLRIFRTEWKNGICLGLLTLLVSALLVFDARICGMELCPMPVRVFGIIAILFNSSIIAHIFLCNAMFKVTTMQAIKNACLLAVLHPLRNTITAIIAVLLWMPGLRSWLIAKLNKKTYQDIRATYEESTSVYTGTQH